MSAELAVDATALTKAHGSTAVLHGLDVAVPRGHVFALLGPNGAGKTTTVRILSTLTEPDSGTARVAGFDVGRQRHEVRRRISLTGQFAALDQLQTGTENLQMMGRLRGLTARSARARAVQLLTQFDLTDAGERRVVTYSGGMRRRLDLAAGLVGRPEVLFLDEPTTGLDPRGRQDMWNVVTGLARDGVTVFLTTQYLEEADRLADEIAVVDRGRIVARGSANQLKRLVAGQRIDLQAVDDTAFAEVRARLGPRAVQEDPSARTIGVATDGTARDVRALLDELDPTGRRIERFSLHTASLDDVFLTLTRRPDPINAESETADV